MSNRGVPSVGYRMTTKRKEAIAKAAELGITIDPSIFINRETHLMSVDELVSFARNGGVANPIDLVHQPRHVEHQQEYHQETEEEIIARIEEKFTALRDITIATAMGVNRALIVSGSPGVGKSHEVELYASQHSNKVNFIKGYSTPTQLFRLLYENRFDDSVLVFDDCDSVFSDENALNLLKAACDSCDERTISWYSSNKIYDTDNEEIPESFEFEGSIIFITNVDFQAVINKDTKASPHYEALVSRSMYLDLGLRSYAERLARVRQVIVKSGMLDDLEEEKVDQLMDYMHSRKHKLREISLRTARKIATLIEVNEENWVKLADMVCCR